jgi:hypothetical protein
MANNVVLKKTMVYIKKHVMFRTIQKQKMTVQYLGIPVRDCNSTSLQNNYRYPICLPTPHFSQKSSNTVKNYGDKVPVRWYATAFFYFPSIVRF